MAGFCRRQMPVPAAKRPIEGPREIRSGDLPLFPVLQILRLPQAQKGVWGALAGGVA
jgi:hypothetical protein